MTDHACQLENDTSHATRTGAWTDSLRAHVEDCADCRQTRAVTALMSRAASAFGRDETAPDPTLILIKAKLVEREHRERRVARHKLIGIGLACAAVMSSAWIAIRFVGPILAEADTVLALAGASLLLVPLVVWYFGLRPLRRAL